MRFNDLQTNIQDYIKNNLGTYLTAEEVPEVDAYIDDVVDLDRYKENVQVFFDFADYSFQALSNESNQCTGTMYIYFVFLNARGKNSYLYGAGNALYSMLKASGDNFDGLIDFAMVSQVSFIPDLYSNPDIKMCRMQIQFRLED